MNQTMINSLLKALGRLVKDKTKARRSLERYFAGKFVILWTVEDVYRAANERGRVFNQQEALSILQKLEHGYNRQNGIKWLDLWDLIDESSYGRPATKQKTKAFVEKDVVAIARGR